MDTKDLKDKIDEGVKGAKDKFDETFTKENIEAGKEKLKATGAKANEKIKGLPFRRMAETKIPAATRAKFPLLDKLIPLANQIVCGLAAVLAVVVIVACTRGGGGGGSSGGGAASSRGANPDTHFQYDLTKDGQGISIRRYIGPAGKVVIPATIEGFPVVQIAQHAFRGQTESQYFDANQVTEVVIPDSVKRIDYRAFYWNDNITTVNLPISLEQIGNRAFEMCKNLSTIHIPDSLTSIRWVDIDGNENTGRSKDVFSGCGKIPIRTRQRLHELGYTSMDGTSMGGF